MLLDEIEILLLKNDKKNPELTYQTCKLGQKTRINI
jgi:hypothetical protein